MKQKHVIIRMIVNKMTFIVLHKIMCDLHVAM